MKIKALSMRDTLFFLSYGVFLGASILSLSFYYKFFNGLAYKGIMTLCIAVLLFRELISTVYTVRRLTGIGISIILILMVWFNTQGATRSTLICMIVLIYGSRNIHFIKIAKFSLFLSCMLCAFIILSSQAGIIDDYVYISNEGRVRHYMGFRYSLYGPAILYNIIMLSYYIYSKKWKWRYIFLLTLVNMWVFIQTNSRTSFVLACLILLCAVFKKVKIPSLGLKRIFFYWVTISFSLLFVLSIYLTISYTGKPWQQKLDRILDTRISLANASYQEHGISLAGKDIHWVGNGLNAKGEQDVGMYSYVDNLYMQMLQRYGVLFTFIAIFLLTRIMYKSFRRRDYDLMFILMLISMKSIIDDQALWLYYNTFLFTMAGCFWNERGLWRGKRSQLN